MTRTPQDIGVMAEFAAALARTGIVMPPDRVEAAAADALALHHQVLLIRAACPPGAALPTGFAVKLPRGEV
jgi:hypothetical protein